MANLTGDRQFCCQQATKNPTIAWPLAINGLRMLQVSDTILVIKAESNIRGSVPQKHIPTREDLVSVQLRQNDAYAMTRGKRFER